MPITIDLNAQQSTTKIKNPYSIKFFHKKLTGDGKTRGIICKVQNPYFITPDEIEKPSVVSFPKKNYTNNGVEVLQVPFYIIAKEEEDNVEKIKFNEFDTCACIAKNNTSYQYAKLIPYSLLHEIETNQAGAKVKRTTVCYQLRIFTKQINSQSDEFICSVYNRSRQQTVDTYYTANPSKTMAYIFNHINIHAAYNDPFTTYENAWSEYILNYSLYDELQLLSEAWQTKIPTILKNFIRHHIKNANTNTNVTDTASILRRIENYELPLDMYKDIYDVIKHEYSEKERKYLYKQNLNLLLSHTLRSLENKKSQITGLPTTTPTTAITTTRNQTFSTEQYNAVSTTEPLVLVQAGAGTGKSTVILGRIDYMISTGIDPKDITVLSFTNAAANNILNRNPNVHSMTIASMINEIYAYNYPEHRLSNLDTIINVIEAEFPYNAVAREFRRVLWSLVRDTVFTPTNNFIEEHMDEVMNILNTIKLTSLELEIILCYQQIESLAEPSTIQSKYLIIDEVQDNSVFEFIYVLKYINKHNESLFMVGDCSQTLYEFRASKPQALNVLESSGVFSTYQLQTNYRSNQAILDYANVFLKDIKANQNANIQLRANNLAPVTEQEFKDKVKAYYYIMRTKQDLFPRSPKTASDSVLAIALSSQARNFINDKLSKGEQIAILAPTNKLVKIAEQAIQKQCPTAKLVNISPEKTNKETTISTYIKRYWNEVVFMPTQKISDTIIISILNRLDGLTNSRNQDYIQNTLKPHVIRLLDDWNRSNAATIAVLQNEYATNKITHNELLDEIKKSLLDYEIKFNNIKQKIVQNKNEENKKSMDIKNADFIFSTIHSAKGLEFDNVIVVHLAESSDDEPAKRMYYVAFTRAMKSEFILSFGTQKKSEVEHAHESICKRLHDQAIKQQQKAILSAINNTANNNNKSDDDSVDESDNNDVPKTA